MFEVEVGADSNEKDQNPKLCEDCVISSPDGLRSHDPCLGERAPPCGGVWFFALNPLVGDQGRASHRQVCSTSLLISAATRRPRSGEAAPRLPRTSSSGPPFRRMH